MTDTAPSETYYRACCGTWRSPISIEIDDPLALARSGMSWGDRWSLRLLAAWPALFGRLYLDTSVAFRAAHEVVHTTTVRWLGLPLQHSEEVFTLSPDGTTLTVRGGMTGEGRIDADAVHGTYHLRWLGAEIQQRTTREVDRVTVEQRGPGFRGVQVLQRTSP